MDRFQVEVAIQAESVPGALLAHAAPRLLVGLGVTGGGTCRLRFGSRDAELLFAPEPGLRPDRLELSPSLAEGLGLQESISLTANRTGHREVTLGPLIGLAISPAKLAAVLGGRRDFAYCRYARHAREAGIALIFFCEDEIEAEAGCVTGYTHQCDGAKACQWTARQYPVPGMVYDRSFGKAGRESVKAPTGSAPSATYLGAPFGLRALVQRDVAGGWAVTALVACVGKRAIPVDRALRHAFPERWEAVLADVERLSLQQTARADGERAPCLELGLELSVKPDGAVKVADVNAKPLRLLADRVRDPLISERIYRWPIHAAAAMELRAGPGPQAPPAGGGEPTIGVLLPESPMSRLHGRQEPYFRQMVREAADAGARLLFFEAAEVDVRAGTVRAWVEHGDRWAPRTLPVPEVIYNRAHRVGGLLLGLRTQHGAVLINGAEEITQRKLAEALAAFQATATLAGDDGPMLELRVLLQKGGEGEWAAPLVLTRTGKRFPGPQPMVAAAASAALLAAAALEARFGLLGELGLQLGLDREGRLWVRGVQTVPPHPDLPEPRVRNPLRYGVWLAHRAREARRSGLPAPVRLT